MILNLNQLNASQKNTWKALAEKLAVLGFNLKVFSANESAIVFNQESGLEVGKVSREMIEDEEIDYILKSRLQLIVPTSSPD